MYFFVQVVYMAENDTLSLRAEVTSDAPKTVIPTFSNTSFCLTLSMPHERPAYVLGTKQTTECMKKGAPLIGRCINIQEGSHQLKECERYSYKINCMDQMLCGGADNRVSACATYKDTCIQNLNSCRPFVTNPKLRFKAIFPGPSGSFTYLPQGRKELGTQTQYASADFPTIQNNSIPCTCIAFFV